MDARRSIGDRGALAVRTRRAVEPGNGYANNTKLCIVLSNLMEHYSPRLVLQFYFMLTSSVLLLSVDNLFIYLFFAIFFIWVMYLDWEKFLWGVFFC